jgi:TolB-like protein/DNA-binding winged helix-turn-helix (wHTH) protein/Tfp pilus assembly protein PilF
LGSATTQAGVRFGEDFELDLQAYRLLRAGRALRLERIPMEILLLLVERRGQIVSREEIVQRVWGKDVFLDTDNSINGAIRKIRQALRDDPEQPRFIQTITGQGYRFIAPVVSEAKDVSASSSAVESDETQASVPAAEQEASRPSSITTQPVPAGRVAGRRVLFVAGGAALLAATGGLWWFHAHISAQAQRSAQKLMLAVLPFQNLTGDASQEYFTDGMTEEMITELGNLDPQRLSVIARTSVMHYKNNPAALDQVARELGVQYVIEGSVRRDADRIRVTAQLIETKDQTHVWAREYDRELKGVLALQGEIAHELADEIELTLGTHAAPDAGRAIQSPENYEAYDLYLKGLYFFNKRTARDLEQAIAYFEQAAGKDPKYARAYAGLADSYALMGGYSGRAQTEFMLKARAAALHALELDDRLPEGHTALALIVQNYDWDWQTAEREFRRAIELNPNYATAHHWYAEHLMWRGRFLEALQESERARQLDPLSLIIAADNGAILFYSRQYDGAIEKWRSVLEMDPGFRRAHLIANAYVEKGMLADAVADAKDHPEIPASTLSMLAYIDGRSGKTAEAQRSLQELLKMDRARPLDPMYLAWPYIGMGDSDQALVWLERAYAQHSNELVSLKVAPGFDPLRADPRFRSLLRRVRLDD